MRISFDNINSAKASDAISKYSSEMSVTGKGLGSSFDISSSLSDNQTYDGQKTGLKELKDSLSVTDVQTNKDYMAVMSNCMSDEDFAKMVASGENPGDVEIEDSVTIVDRIKLAVAKSGQDIKGYTDTLDADTIEAMTGLRSMDTAAKEEDVTLDEDTCKDIKEAYDKVSSITDMTEGMKKYLVTENLSITPDNLYLAKHSACDEVKEQGSGYFTIETYGYLAKKGSEEDISKLEDEVSDLLKNIGVESTDENIGAGVWLVKNSVTVTKENIEKVNSVDAFLLPVTDEDFSKSVAVALSEGADPGNADLTKTENVYDQAVRLTAEIEKLADSPFVKETRVLEETRLKMTTEANLMLLKSDYSIDTKDLESYVEALKKLENSDEFKISDEVSKTIETVETVKTLPAAVIAPIAKNIDLVTLSDIADTGTPIKAKYDQANIAYEQVATEVRRDLGDSIQKAFRNVPDILSELGMEDSAENERAVRILGYNSMEITKESVDEVKDADRKLQSVISRITPKDTLSLIRKGSSPIKMSVEDLNKYLDSKVDTEKEDIEKYSKFLYKLEQDNDITEEERSDYIEVYRFFHQIDKTGAASVGAVVNAGQELTLSNLKTAMKSAKHRGMDVTVGEVYNTLVESSPDDELETDWMSAKYNEMKEALKAPEETVTELVMNNLPVTAENLEAALNLRKHRGEAFKKASEASDFEAREDALGFTDDLVDSETAKVSFDSLTNKCKEAVYKEAMFSNTYMDVRALQLVHMQLNVAKGYSGCENYEVPMEIGGQVTSVNVKLVHNSKEDPNVVVSMETEELGRVTARLSKENEEITGYIACNLKEAVTKMQDVADKLSTKVSVVQTNNPDSDLKLSRIPMRDNDDSSAKDLYDVARKFLECMKG